MVSASGHTAPLWISATLIALHSALFGIALCCLGPFLKSEYLGSINHDVELSTIQQALATSALLLACVPGSLVTGPMIDAFGNRYVLIGNGLLWMLGGIFMLFHSVLTVIIGRFIIGLAVGVASVISPLFLNEIEPAGLKGKVANCHQLFCTGAQLIIYLIILPCLSVNHGWKWVNSGVFIFFGFIAFVTGFWVPESPLYLLKNGREGEAFNVLTLLRTGTKNDFFSKLRADFVDFSKNPKSLLPTFSNKSKSQSTDLNDLDPDIVATHQIFYGDDDDIQANVNNASQFSQIQAHQQLSQIHDDNNSLDTSPNEYLPQRDSSTIGIPTSAQEATNTDDPLYVELQQLKTLLGDGTGAREATWNDLFLPEYRLQILLCIGLMMLQPLVGINAVVMFATRLFSFAGLSDSEAMWGTIAIGLLGFVFSLLCSILLDKLGRKLLIMIGSAACAFFLFLLSASLLWMDGFAFQGMLSLMFTLLYIISFQPLGGPIWVILSELTSSNIRGKAMAIYCSTCWILNFLIVFATLPMMTLFGGGDSDPELKKGAGWLFFIFCAVGIAGLLFSWFFLVETSGKSEEQIQKELAGGSSNGDLTPVLGQNVNSDSAD
jgi:MFS family permease